VFDGLKSGFNIILLIFLGEDVFLFNNVLFYLWGLNSLFGLYAVFNKLFSSFSSNESSKLE
jgi:hypothetical protein